MIGSVVLLIALPVVFVGSYDLVLWRWGYVQTGWCERTARSSPDAWGVGYPVGAQTDFSRSSDYQCDPCSIAFTRSPRFVLEDVDEDRRVVEPCDG